MDIKELQALLDKGYGGRQLAALHTAKTDSFLSGIFYSICDGLPLCLMAIGGYGRGELAPFSDIDIMLFARDRSASETAKEILYRLWDARLDISHSFRTPADCISEAKKDARTKTALLEHRYIAGDFNLYRYFCDNIYSEIAFRKQREFISEKLREAELRHRKSGDSVYMLEPNIKDGKGGLRDIQTVTWLTSVKLRLRHFDELSKLLTPENFARLSRAYDFLLKVRFCLHILSGRKNDVLSYEFHDRLADLLRFKTSARFLASERFMRYLYLKQAVVNDMASLSGDLITTPYALNRAAEEEGAPRFFFPRKRISPDFYISKDRLASTPGIFSKAPERIMEAFSLMSGTGKAFSPRLREEVRKNLFRINKKTRVSQRAVEWFMEVLRGERVYETLREMHASGVLGRFIPEFGALSFLVVYQPYHLYTVDEHTFCALKNLLALENTKYKKLSRLSAIFKGIKDKEALVLALLLHDIGKGSGGRHEEIGYKDLKNIAERFNLNIELRGRTEFLVKKHTLMPEFALRRELDDPEVIPQFADEVATGENLDALYLLTYADMSAVNPEFLTDWKAYLLLDLYEKTYAYLSGLGSAASEGPETWGGYARADIERFVSLMPTRYIIPTSHEKVLSDYELYLEVVTKGFSLKVKEASGGVELTIGGWDRPGLFAGIVGVLASMGMNIYRARIYTGEGGLVIDRLYVSNWKELWWSGMEQQLAKRLNIAVCGTGEAAEGLQSKVQQDKGGLALLYGKGCERFAPFIEIDNESSANSSLVEIFAHDRLGFLYDILSLMHEKKVDIISARINTESGLINDIFDVQTDGGKLNNIKVYELLVSIWEKIAG